MSDSCEIPWEGHSSTAAPTNLEMSNNGTWSDAFQFGTTDDTTWTLDGQSFELDVQRNPYDETPLLSINSASGQIVIADTVQRVIYFNVPADVIQLALRPGLYVYDLVMVDAFNVRVPLMYGTLKVNQGVTYPPVG